METGFKSHPFWDYSLEVYQRDGVSSALIKFQDRHGLDVNILLLCLWFGCSGRGELDDEGFAHALSVSSSWNPSVVCAIRDIRIRLRDEIPMVSKDLSDIIRKNILQIEIECEHVEQLAIVAGINSEVHADVPLQNRLSDCGQNLSSYFEQNNSRIDDEDREALATIISAAFAEIGIEIIHDFCKTTF